jgi:hypothetical protein
MSLRPPPSLPQISKTGYLGEEKSQEYFLPHFRSVKMGEARRGLDAEFIGSRAHQLRHRDPIAALFLSAQLEGFDLRVPVERLAHGLA